MGTEEMDKGKNPACFGPGSQESSPPSPLGEPGLDSEGGGFNI